MLNKFNFNRNICLYNHNFEHGKMEKRFGKSLEFYFQRSVQTLLVSFNMGQSNSFIFKIFFKTQKNIRNFGTLKLHSKFI